MSKSMSKEMVQLIGAANQKGTSPYDTQAEVIRVEGSIAWVHIPGGIDETPARMTMNAKAGDVVQVRVSGGRAWLTGNASSPPTDNTEAFKARDTAFEAKEIAEASIEDAERAKEAADSAEASAKKAHEKAEEADDAAKEAKASAVTANKAANGALSQLSVVEDVVGTLTWISEHGEYAPTEDTEVVSGKYYFTKYGDQYNVVISPEGNPKEQGYYELTSVDEAVTSYVASHLALTDAGLWVTKDNEGYKLLLSGDGLRVYDDEGNLVAIFGESINFSSSRPQYIGGEDAFIIFYASNNDGIPDSINIGGSKVTLGGSKKLSDLLTTLDISTRQTDTGAEIIVGDKSVTLKDGIDATVLRIDSSRGTVFKNNSVNTVLTVAIYIGGQRITNNTDLRKTFGTSAHLQWYWQKLGEDTFGIIVASDHKLSDDGFTLTLTPEEVDTKVTFMCELITD
ncbi:hypothetical protein BHK98_02490 [Hornefia porci]|uniref:Uncharacterized protein n=1 Tax=Hornefia porci TaxID=2652292 RepID=A0A1Q9JG04_9FIRM|nr:hypothetical protein [Hornefia porci]OLR55031.1 hypothetical protein BHK98_02490 [Hornefia porci]